MIKGTKYASSLGYIICFVFLLKLGVYWSDFSILPLAVWFYPVCNLDILKLDVQIVKLNILSD